MRIDFTIPGKPGVKGRPKFMRNGHTYTDDKTTAYENLVKLAYMQAGGAKFEGPVIMHIDAYFPIPKRASKKLAQEMRDGVIPYTSRPDVDNIAKIVQDALNGIAYNDDGQICNERIIKLYSDVPRVEVCLMD